MSVFISFIIPVYNRPKEIQACIESIMPQTNRDFEIIVIDDHSTDDTVAVVRQYLNVDGINLRLITCEQNGGVNIARNKGIQQAQGEYLYFLDSDDLLSGENVVASIADYYAQYPDIAHFLYRVSDREKDKSLPDAIQAFHYKNWLEQSIDGDFVHVLRRSTFDRFYFDERFRIFETLSWLRIFKQNPTQLYIPFTATDRDQGREDSISREYALTDKTSIHNYYTYFYLLCQWYYEDYTSYQLQYQLFHSIRRAIWMGTAIGEYQKNRYFISLLKENNQPVLKYKIINNLLFKNYAFKRISQNY